MKLKLLKCDWGMEHLGDVAARFRAYASAGYDGVEASFADLDAGELRELLRELRLDHVAMVFARDEKEFGEQLGRVRKLDPILVNCHAGRDHYSFERGLSLFRTLSDMAHDALGCEIVFETQVSDPTTGSGLEWTERFEEWWGRIIGIRATSVRSGPSGDRSCVYRPMGCLSVDDDSIPRAMERKARGARCRRSGKLRLFYRGTEMPKSANSIEMHE